MKKKSKALFLITLFGLVSISTGYWYIQRYMDSELQNIAFDIKNYQVVHLANDSMIVNVTFSLSRSITPAVSFYFFNMEFYFENILLGYGQIKNNKFNTAQSELSIFLIITVTNDTLFSSIIDFMFNKSQMTMEMRGKIGFLYELMIVPPVNFAKSMSLMGFNGFRAEMQKFQIVNSSTNSLDIDIEAIFQNPSLIETDLTNVSIALLYLDTLIGRITQSAIFIRPGTNIFQFKARLGENPEILSQFLGDYLAGKKVSMKCNLTTYIGSLPQAKKAINYFFEMNMTGPKMDFFKAEIKSIGFAPDFPIGLNYVVNCSMTIFNIANYTLKLNSFKGWITYDDLDGTMVYEPKSNITMMYANLTWSPIPADIPVNGNYTEYLIYEDNDAESAWRLNDEYITKNQLYIDVQNGIMDAFIGEFRLIIPHLYLYDIYMPKN